MEADAKGILDAELLAAVLDQLGSYICVTDADTDTMVYMNSAMKQAFDPAHPEEQLCRQIVNCGQKDNTYKDCDSLLLLGQKRYHVHIITDVTEYQQTPDPARIDELMGIPNRKAGKQKLARLMAETRDEQRVLVVALCDINDLKAINDCYGYSEGDHLLRYVADTVGQRLDSRDIIFRLSGDEFVVALFDEDLGNAEKRIKGFLELLKESREGSGIFYSVSFSYGLVEIYPGEEYTVSDVIAKADMQMYLQKRNYHILRAKQNLDELGSYTKAVEDFQYDKNHLYDALVSSTDDYIFVGNMKTGVFRYPPAMVEEFGLPGMILENAAAFWGRIIYPQDEMAFLESNQEIADGRAEYHNIEYRAKNAKGEWIWLRCRGKMIRDENGAPNLFAGFITNLGKKNQIDHMTGLYNRFEFEGSIKKNLVDDKTTCSLGILILDMDGFKNINDLYNRSFGDEVLRITAQKISSMLPSNARIYRLDGDEFGILIVNGSDAEGMGIFKKIQHSFQRQQEFNGRKYYCTLSAGYAAYPKDADNYLALMKYANYSLEYSKAMGKNKITLFSPKLLEQKTRKLELTEALRESIDRGYAGFSVSFQPQVDSNTKELYGAEALARWNYKSFGEVSPVEFIPILEQSGLIIQVGCWIFRQAAAKCRDWCKIKKDFHISVNLSFLQLLEEDFLTFVKDTLEEFELAPANVTMELTETYFIKDNSAVLPVLNRLSEMGILLAMDDFGVGYSSLFALKNTPAGVIKIDRGFIKGITTDLFTSTFIRSITELCHDAGKRVCMEGVETKEEYDLVKNIGIDLIQGYYFGRPISAPMFEKHFL